MDLELQVSEVIAIISQWSTLSLLIVWLVEEIKKLLPDNLKKYMFLVAVFMWIVLVISLSMAFPDIINLTTLQSTIVWVFVWLFASGLYNWWLWKKTSEVITNKPRDATTTVLG